MNYSRRLDPLANHRADDEELPDYEPVGEAAPDYTFDTTPLHTYHLRQVDRKLQLFVPYGPSTSSSYKAATRSSRLFSKKAEVDVWRMPPGKAAEEHVAGLWFDNDGPLPWRPRAHFILDDERGTSTYAMESRNFSDWSIAVGGTEFAWMLQGHRCMYLCLRQLSSNEVVARFNFSARGTTAEGGAEAGDLSIYRHALVTERGGTETILCALVVALASFKKMGRHYKNDVGVSQMRLTTWLTGEPQRASVGTTTSTV